MKLKTILIKGVFSLVYYSDQSLRLKLGKVNNMLYRRIIWWTIKLSDVLNQVIVKLVLNNFGWPSKNIYGERTSLTAYYVIMHSTQKSISKYIKMLAKAVDQQEADCRHLLNMIDRLLKYRGKKQIYGNAIRGLRTNGKLQYYIYPIVNKIKVNERRMKVGLTQTIEEYAKANNAVLDYNQDILIRLTKYPSN